MAPDALADTDDVDALTLTGMDLEKAKPTSMAEFLAKWRQIARFEAEHDDGSLDGPAIMTKMLNELSALL
jgi:hypothetical protein